MTLIPMDCLYGLLFLRPHGAIPGKPKNEVYPKHIRNKISANKISTGRASEFSLLADFLIVLKLFSFTRKATFYPSLSDVSVLGGQEERKLFDHPPAGWKF